MEKEIVSTDILEKHQTKDTNDSHINGSLTVVWRDWDNKIKNDPKMVYVSSVNPGEIKGPHLHKKRLTKIFYTTEVILLLKGILRVDFYNTHKKYLFSKILKEKDIIMLVHGGHGFKILKDVEMLEIKQGPYNLIKDKIKFENIDYKKVKLAK